MQYPVVYLVDAVVFPCWKTEVINSAVPPVAKGMVAPVSARSPGPSLRSSPQKSSPSKGAAKGQAGNDHKTAPRGAKGVVATESASAAGPSLKPSPQMSSPSKGVAKGQEGQGHRARAKANGQRDPSGTARQRAAATVAARNREWRWRDGAAQGSWWQWRGGAQSPEWEWHPQDVSFNPCAFRPVGLFEHALGVYVGGTRYYYLISSSSKHY